MTSTAPRSMKQAAAELNVSWYTVKNWVALRKIGHIKLGRAVRIPVSEIQRVLAEGEIPRLRA